MEKKMLKRSLAVWMVLALLFVCAAPVALMEGEATTEPSAEETVADNNIINEESDQLLDENAEMLDNVTVEESSDDSNEENVEEPAAEAPAEEESSDEASDEEAAEEATEETSEEAPVVEMLYLDYEAHLYAGPSVDSEWLCYIPGPSEHVVIAYDGHWANIEYYDAETDTLFNGYVYCLEEAPVIPDDAEHIATLEDALAPDCSIDIYVSWGDQEAAIGNTATLYASLNGYDNVVYYIQWQTSKDGSTWADVEGAMGYTLPVTVTLDNYLDYWRVVVTVTAVKE